MSDRRQRPAPPPLPSRTQWVALMQAAAVAADARERKRSQAAVRTRRHGPAAHPAAGMRPAKHSSGAPRRVRSAAFGMIAAPTREVFKRCGFGAARQLLSWSRAHLIGAPVPLTSRPADSVTHHDLEAALAREQWRGTRLLALAGVVIFGFAAWIPLSGAVVVPGSLVVQSSLKKVQHPQGGIVSAILVRNGSKVAAGDEVARLDQTAARANLQVVARQLDEVRLRIARLKAERDNLETPRWPSIYAAEIDPADRSETLASERSLFAARANSRRSQQELAQSRLSQLEKQIIALEAQLKSNGRQSDITGGELGGIEELLRQKLVPTPRVTALQREVAQLDGVRGQLSAQIAETRAKESETQLQALQAEESFRTEVMRDLREAEAREGELIERELAARDQMARTSIRAPSAGTIHELALNTIGGVITPGEVLMLVVPDDDALAIEAHLGTDKIDQVHVGQPARVRLSAFDQRTTPELAGTVEVVSADVTRDAQSGATFYSLRIALSADEPHRIGSLQLHPGMPAEVFLETGSRTMLSYLFKPLADQMRRMFRER